MDNTQHAAQMGAQMGGSLSLAVDRLDRALEALESRVRALQNGDTVPAPQGAAVGTPEGAMDEYQHLLNELEEVRAREQQLSQAAHQAFEALGMAAANIRILLRDEAA